MNKVDIYKGPSTHQKKFHGSDEQKYCETVGTCGIFKSRLGKNYNICKQLVGKYAKIGFMLYVFNYKVLGFPSLKYSCNVGYK
jgi:hypothetical protein